MPSPPPTDSVHFCAFFDYEQWRREHPRPAGKRLAALGVGEPRTVRMIYFLPNDRPYSAAVFGSVKTKMRQMHTFLPIRCPRMDMDLRDFALKRTLLANRRCIASMDNIP